MIPLWRLLRWGSPLPIPNREVKPTSADGTWSKARESMSMPILKSEKPCSNARLFAFMPIHKSYFINLTYKSYFKMVCLPTKPTGLSGPRISKARAARLRAAVGCQF